MRKLRRREVNSVVSTKFAAKGREQVDSIGIGTPLAVMRMFTEGTAPERYWDRSLQNLPRKLT
jgi:hypothetical protein